MKCQRFRLTPNGLSCIREKAAEKKEENVISAFIAPFMAARGTMGMECKGSRKSFFEKARPHSKASFTFAEQDFAFKGRGVTALAAIFLQSRHGRSLWSEVALLFHISLIMLNVRAVRYRIPLLWPVEAFYGPFYVA